MHLPLQNHICHCNISSKNRVSISDYQYSVRAFAKLRKATISFVVSVRLYVRPSVRRHGTTQLPLDQFSWNPIWVFFENQSEKNLISLKCDKNSGHFTWRPTPLSIISRSVLLRMRNVWEKGYRENHETHIMSSKFFGKIFPFLR